MTAEQEFRELLTDKLIEVAEHPERRKKFSLTFEIPNYHNLWEDDYLKDVDSGRNNNCVHLTFYKDEPMISCIEQFAYIIYLVDVLLSNHDKIDWEAFTKIDNMVNDIGDEWERVELNKHIKSLIARYFLKRRDKKALYTAMLSVYTNSPLFTGLGAVNIDNLERFYDFMVWNESWFIVRKFANILLMVTDQQGAPLTDPNYRLQIQEKFTKKGMNFLCKVHKDIYVDKIVPEKFNSSKCDGMIVEDENLWASLQRGIAIAYRYESPIKRPKPEKGSFDYLYNKAERGDKKAMSAIAEAYRTGTGTHANQRLADYWQRRSEN